MGIGSQLKCCQASTTPKDQTFMKTLAAIGKGKLDQKAWLVLAEVLTFIIEYFLPLYRRLVSLGIYVVIVMGIFMITEENLLEMCPKIIEAGFYLAMLKGAGDAFLDAIFSWLLSLIYLRM